MLPVLLAVDREGGIIAAADYLHISPSAVSQNISALERDIGLDLIERTPSGAILTPAGRLVVQGAEKVETTLNDTVISLLPLTNQVSGHVSIAAFPTIIRTILLPFIVALERDMPGIDINLEETDEAAAMAGLRRGVFDLMVIERDTDGSATPRGYTDTLLIDEPWVLATPDSAPPIGSERDLANLRWLRSSAGNAGDYATRRITGQITHPQWSQFSYINYSTAEALVRAGLGSTVFPSLALESINTDGIRITPLHSLGARRILLRNRTKTMTPDSPTGQVHARLLQWVADHPWSYEAGRA